MRWILFVPLGVYELILLTLTFLAALVHKKTAWRLYNHAQKLPDVNWYKESKATENKDENEKYN